MATLVVVVVAVLLIGYGLHRAALFADRRGWLYYRTKPRLKGSTLGLLEEIYNPAMTHVIDEQQENRSIADQDESGDPPGDEHP